MNNLKNLICPHCSKNIDITDYFKNEISDAKSKLEEQFQNKIQETALSNKAEVEDLKRKIIQEQQNSKLLKSQLENEIREEFLNEQDNIQKRIEESIKNKYELKLMTSNQRK